MEKSQSSTLESLLFQGSMLISWVQKLSLIDYPGKVACVVFTPGCNLRCSFCHNPEFVLPNRIEQIKDSFPLEKDFFAFLEKRKWLIDGVSICGGEPTLQPWLIRFIEKVKSLGYLVKLDTNGRDPKILKKLIDENLVDYIAMDIKHTWEKYPLLVGGIGDIFPYRESARVILESDIEHEFRTTVILPYHTTWDIETIAKTIRWAKRYFLQSFRSGDTLDPNFNGYTPERILLSEMRQRAEHFVKECNVRY